MKKADIKTGFLCNSNCRFCVQGDQKKTLGNKSTAELKKILKEASRDCQIVVFTGGEVTIRPDLVELVTHARQLKFKTIQIQSNGRAFMSKDYCRKIIKAGASEFALALAGHTAALHNFLSQSESFEQTVRGVRNLRKLNQRILMNTVITKSNYRHLPEIVKLLISLDVDQMQLAFAHALGAAAINFDNVIPRMTLVMPYVLKSIRIARHFNKDIVTEAIPFCCMPGYEEHIAETRMPAMKIFDNNHVVPNFKQARIQECKAKGSDCPECVHFHSCEGLWREYPAAFGWDEFVPVKG